MSDDRQELLVERLDQTLDEGAGAAGARTRDQAAAERLLSAIRKGSANTSHILLAQTEADKAAGRPMPRDDEAYLLLLFPEALNVVMGDALKRTEEAFTGYFAEAELVTQNSLKRAQEAAEARFEAAADRAFERASSVIRKHANELDVLTKKLHAEMQEHVARHQQLQATTKHFFDRMGAGLLASAEARVKEDAEYTAQMTAKTLASELREVVREAVRDELAQSNKGLGNIFKR